MSQTPDALLFIAPGCPHCPVVLQGLAELVKSGAIGALEVVNVAAHPERAAELGVRAAPWTRIGAFVLEGAQTPATLRQWVERAGRDEGGSEYLRELLAGGRLAEAERFVNLGRWADVLPLLSDVEAPMQVRVGANALLEGAAGSEALAALVPELGALAGHTDHRLRADACYLLGLSGSAAAKPLLRERLEDDSAEVREIAREALEELERGG